MQSGKAINNPHCVDQSKYSCKRVTPVQDSQSIKRKTSIHFFEKLARQYGLLFSPMHQGFTIQRVKGVCCQRQCRPYSNFFSLQKYIPTHLKPKLVSIYRVEFLAHLSRRLKGELIVYQSSCRLCVCVCLCVCKHFQT